MRKILRSLFTEHSPGVRWLLAVFGLSYLVALVLIYGFRMNPYAWIGLRPVDVFHGQVWRLFTYGLTPAGLLDWLFGLIWFSVLGGQLERLWSSCTLWFYCLVGAVGGALPVLFFVRDAQLCGWLVGSAPMTFGLLAAWYRLCGHEELILHGLGRTNVRQAAIIIGALNIAIVFVGMGWKITLCLLGGAVAVWIAMSLHRQINISRMNKASNGTRIDRLEV